MLTDVVIRAILTSYTGYGQIAEWLGRSLEWTGLRVHYEDYGAEEHLAPMRPWVAERLTDRLLPHPVIHLATPDTPFDVTDHPAVFTMWESTGLPNPRLSIPYLNRARAVVVPCRWNAENFRTAGVKTPIHVCPLGVCPGEGYIPRPIAMDGPTRFGMAARLNHGGVRKGFKEGIKAFLEAFPDPDEPVELWVKIHEDDMPFLGPVDDIRIRLLTTTYSPPQMAAWWHKQTVAFVPSKGEGWGLHTLQAMACGRPAIAAKYSGTAEFWDGRFGWELDYHEEPAGEFYKGAGDWCLPHHDSMVAALRMAHRDRRKCAELGMAAAQQAQGFDWASTGRRLRAILEAA